MRKCVYETQNDEGASGVEKTVCGSKGSESQRTKSIGRNEQISNEKSGESLVQCSGFGQRKEQWLDVFTFGQVCQENEERVLLSMD